MQLIYIQVPRLDKSIEVELRKYVCDEKVKCDKCQGTGRLTCQGKLHICPRCRGTGNKPLEALPDGQWLVIHPDGTEEVMDECQMPDHWRDELARAVRFGKTL